jgi:hypothetical protein
MNTEVTLRCVFGTSSDKKLTLSYAVADPGAPAAAVKTFMQLCVANGDIFAERPMSLIGAEFVSRAITPINVS